MTDRPLKDGPAGPPTLETVAAMAGVSRATASRVVNGDVRVRADLRLSVEDAVARLGFVPNRAARSLATRRTDSIALVMREPVEFGVVDPYLSGIAIGVSHALIGTGLQLVMLMAPAGDDHAQVADYVRAHVDGVVLLSVHDGDPLPAELARHHIPMVVGGRPPRLHPTMSFVDVDNRGGARAATAHLVGGGRRTVATIAGPPDMTAAVDRLAGFRDALQEASRAVDLVAYGDFTAAGGERAMADLLRREPGIDGVFAASDLMAVGAMHALRAAGRAVPADVAVVGFDDVPTARHADPPLTTVRQPVAGQARLLVDALRQRLAGAPESQAVLPTELVVRASA